MAGKRDFVGELKAYVKRSALAAGKETTDLAWGAAQRDSYRVRSRHEE